MRLPWRDEVFCADDGGTGPFWIVADDRTLADAVAIIDRVVGPLEECSARLVEGRVEETACGPRVFVEEDGGIGLWEVEV